LPSTASTCTGMPPSFTNFATLVRLLGRQRLHGGADEGSPSPPKRLRRKYTFFLIVVVGTAWLDTRHCNAERKFSNEQHAALPHEFTSRGPEGTFWVLAVSLRRNFLCWIGVHDLEFTPLETTLRKSLLSEGDAVVCHSYLSTLMLLSAAMLANSPAASATTITDDRDQRTMTSDGSGSSLALGAACGINRQLDFPTSGTSHALRTDPLPMCPDSTNGAVLRSLLWFLKDMNSSTEPINGGMTGVIAGGIAVLGPLCGRSSPGCSAASTPVSAVPEAGTLGLMGSGLVMLIGLARRRFLSSGF
jgi:hypothetical protein